MQAATGGDGVSSITRVLRAAVLRLQKIYIATAGHIEGVPARAQQVPLFTQQGQMAFADGAKEHSSECNEPLIP